MAETKLQKFKNLLAELFMFDAADLDFGIYRIMNAKRDEISKFLDNDLLPQVRETLAELQTADRSGLEGELQEAIQQAKGLGVDPETTAKVKELRTQLAATPDVAALENEVFSDLSNFFSRYYKEGDFLSLPRYKEGVYAIPYEGEEVKLHWANHDQYYVKTSEYFKDYTFKLADNRRVHFKIVNADTEQDNKKAAAGKERRFIFAKENAIQEENGELIISFTYEADPEKRKQNEINKKATEKVFGTKAIFGWLPALKKPEPTEKDKERTLLDKRLTDYTARNTFDYFIHKNLGKFLRRELDFYIKNEVMHLDDVESETALRVEQYLGKIKAIRRIAHKIIDFLAQLEDFQKKLWLKKKFVVETNYCITLDRIPEEFYPEIAANEKQREEWVRLFSINEIKGDPLQFAPKYSEPLSIKFLKANLKLPVDTKLYDKLFRDKLLSSVSSLETSIDGILIKSENYSGIGLLSRRYKEGITCLYIDPPFNLGEEPDYLYKVDYKDASWIALLENRLEAAKKLFSTDSSVFVRCSHDGNMYLRMLLNAVFGINNYRNEIIVRRAELSKGDLNKQFGSIKSVTVNYDNIYWFSPYSDTRYKQIMKPTTEEQAKAHWHSFWKAEDRPNLRYDILGIDLTRHYGQWMWKRERANAAVENYKEYVRQKKTMNESLEEYWKRTGEKCEFVCRDGDGYSSIKYWIPPRSFVMADNNWLDIRGYANYWSFKTENSEPLLKRIIESMTEEKQIVLDFFLGSATTTATAHKLKRKWIGIEMGNHFDSIVINRMKEVLYGEKSGISEDVGWTGGGLFQYIELESYEDALNNLQLQRNETQGELITKHPDLREDYTLRYMLNVESEGSTSLLNIDRFADPFNYKMKISTGMAGETVERNVDLVETFNYLLGLHVKHIDTIRGFKIVEGTNPEGEKILVIWRNIKEKSNAELDEFFQKQGYNTKDNEYNIIYVNGDNNLENLRREDETWKVRLIEEDFKRLMFDVEGI